LNPLLRIRWQYCSLCAITYGDMASDVLFKTAEKLVIPFSFPPNV
jgi:hypothetical protein